MADQQPRNPFEAERYAKLTGFEGRWRDTWWREDFLKLVLARRGVTAAGRVLDVGCGAGHWGRTLWRALGRCALAGVDIEPAFVGRAAAAAEALGIEADYREGAAEELPFADDSFDVVTCQTVMIHVREPAAVLAEMRRVLRPGGLLLLAEPNNVVNYLSFMMTEPRPSFDYMQRQLGFYQTCNLGKQALGMGDSSIGDRLPTLLAAAGLVEIDVTLNDNTPALVPPYAEELQSIERDFVRDHIQGGSWWMGFGPRDNALRMFVAGGGVEADFEPLWSEVMAFQDRVAAEIDAERYGGARGMVFYLVSGVEPR